MLDSETKRRIDSARDILVGKVPDPKSQVEQITIALIYKFMDDMDRQSVELGGKASFFKGEFKKYGWGNIFDPRLGGVEMLNLYGEAITRMSQNANLPELFRNIFKNAYLPYRDPETLKLFLKTINDFTYDHSEKLGDAFEYLLSVLGSQGDAGQFRTPRHIIDFMVQVVDPKKNETVLDPACGTAGFLISAYKHILKSNAGTSPKSAKEGNKIGEASRADLGEAGRGSGLNAQDKQKLYENFTGYDISPDMVRLSLVNLYLHGFVKPQIHEYDSLASEERWNEYADVILANPPFMSPKGGIMPHKKFSVQSNRSEVLFVDYMAEHLTPNGRAAIIVPEGIIFQSAGAYKQLRKYLIEHNFLWAVVSLPAGAFNPYSGVKTSILFLDKSLAKKTDKVLFVKVENDGFDLGAQRRSIDRNDLPETLNVLRAWHDHVVASRSLAKQSPGSDSQALDTVIKAFATREGVASSQRASALSATTSNALLVSISKLAETGDYNLSADRYREVVHAVHHTYPTVRLGDITKIQKGTSITKNEVGEGNVPVIAGGQQPAYFHDIANRDGNVITVSSSGAYAGFLNYFNSPIFASDCTTIKSSDESKLQTYFLYLLLKNKQSDFYSLQQGMGQPHVYSKDFVNSLIPLPPLETQRALMDEIAAHQRIIDGARQVVEGWKSDVEIDPDWDIVGLDTVCDIQRGKFSYRPRNEPRFYGGKYPFIQTGDIVRADGGKITYTQTLNDEGLSVSKLFQPPIVVITIAANIGDTAVLDFPSCFPDSVVGLTPKPQIDVRFLELMMRTKKQYLNDIAPQAAQKNINIEILKTVKIPLPPLEIQREIVARIETERAIVHGNRELIRLYEEKVKKVIERVWEG